MCDFINLFQIHTKNGMAIIALCWVNITTLSIENGRSSQLCNTLFAYTLDCQLTFITALFQKLNVGSKPKEKSRLEK